MRDFEATAAADIHAAFGEPITYTGAGLTDAEIIAIRSDTAALPFDGPGNTLRQVSYEVQKSDLPERPRLGNTISDATGIWSVNDITERTDVAAWVLIVDRAA
jgi:hypothetical protein